jgi:hypothetical protein
MISWIDINNCLSVTLAEVKELIILKPLHFFGVVFLWLCLKSCQRCIQATKKMGDNFILSMIGGCDTKNLGGLRFLPSPE